MTALLVAAGAAVGAPLRLLLSRRFDAGAWPAGTLLVNVLGSLLVGVLAGLSVDGPWLALLGTGFAGAFTTYSAVAVQTHGLGPRRGGAYAATTVVLALAAVFAGFALGAQA